ncbi:MAG: hypothetical protein IJ733_14090 [Lachnospiraceae bacterium]|nr:hypothetical protein [Lachnospiraceae bacterium]
MQLTADGKENVVIYRRYGMFYLDTLQADVLLGKFPVFKDEELYKVNHVADFYSSLLKDVPGLMIPVVKEGMYSS